MDRTRDFKTAVGLVEPEMVQQEPKFYEQMYGDVQSIIQRACGVVSYRGLLALDGELSEITRRCAEVFEGIRIEGAEDTEKHFSGVKYIINKKILEATRELSQCKKKMIYADTAVEPQRPLNCRTVAENRVYAEENKSIMESTQYEMTKQRLKKIEEIQRAIQENLLLQDERIDGIGEAHKETEGLYRMMSGDGGLRTGSIFRRAARTVVYCLAFVLLFVHIFHRD